MEFKQIQGDPTVVTAQGAIEGSRIERPDTRDLAEKVLTPKEFKATTRICVCGDPYCQHGDFIEPGQVIPDNTLRVIRAHEKERGRPCGCMT